MAVLTPEELASLRREISEGVVPVTWDKPTVNVALQGVEDVLEAQAFDPVSLVAVVVENDLDAQAVKASLDAGQVAANLVPVVKFYLEEHPPSVTARSVNTGEVDAHVNANMPAFLTAVAGMPASQRVKVVRFVIRRRVEAVV